MDFGWRFVLLRFQFISLKSRLCVFPACLFIAFALHLVLDKNMQLKPQKWVLLLHMSCSGVHLLLETLPMFGPGTTQKLMAIVFLYCYIVSWVSYYKTATTEPGSPPDGWVTDVPYPESKELLQHGEAAETYILLSFDSSPRVFTLPLCSAPILAYSQEFGSLRFCRVCRNWKPERCHHCRKCARCRLKMDHHCARFFLVSLLDNCSLIADLSVCSFRWCRPVDGFLYWLL